MPVPGREPAFGIYVRDMVFGGAFRFNLQVMKIIRRLGVLPVGQTVPAIYL